MNFRKSDPINLRILRACILDSVQGILTLARPEVARCQMNVHPFIHSCVWVPVPCAGLFSPTVEVPRAGEG